MYVKKYNKKRSDNLSKIVSFFLYFHKAFWVVCFIKMKNKYLSSTSFIVWRKCNESKNIQYKIIITPKFVFVKFRSGTFLKNYDPLSSVFTSKVFPSTSIVGASGNVSKIPPVWFGTSPD